MPQIIVTADTTNEVRERPVMFVERVSVSDFESRHFQTQLVERLGWAVGDAQAVEQHGQLSSEPEYPPAPATAPELPGDTADLAAISAAQPVS